VPPRVELSYVNPRIIHNRFYIPESANYVEAFVRTVELSGPSVLLNATLTVDGTPYHLEPYPSGRNSALEPVSAQFTRLEWALPANVNLRGKVGTLEFGLMNTEPGQISGTVRAQLDDIALVPQPGVRISGPGAPLTAQSESAVGAHTTPFSVENLGALIVAATTHWSGLGVSSAVEMPEGGLGINLRSIGVSATNLSVNQISAFEVQGSEDNRDTGFSEGGINNQSFSPDPDLIQNYVGKTAGTLWIAQETRTDQTGVNRNTSLPSDPHSIKAQSDSILASGKIVAVVKQVGDTNWVKGAFVKESWSAEKDSAIGIPHFNIGGDLPSPSGNGTLADLKIFNLQQIPLQPLKFFTGLVGQGADVIRVSPFSEFKAAAELGQREDQQNQSAFQHSPSFGTPTLPPDRKSVKGVDGNGLSGLFGLSGLSGAFGLSGASAPNVSALSTQSSALDDTPWQLTGVDGSAAFGKIDLMTVLMHELGHVMGLGHVSSAVDGTRLMAGAIDPGVADCLRHST